MGWTGETFSIPCSRGGLNANQNKAAMPPEAMVVGSKNINLKGSRAKRGGTTRQNATVLSGTASFWTQRAAQQPGEARIQAMVVRNGQLYGATGIPDHGLLLKWNNTNAWIQVAPQLVPDSIASLTLFSDEIYGGTYPNAKLYLWNGVDAWSLQAAAIDVDTYISALCEHNSSLYGATAGVVSAGRLYVFTGGAWALKAAQLGVEEIFSLCVFGSNLYAGTSPNGKLYKWNGVDAWTQVAPQLGAETAINCLAVFNSKLYGGTTPNGKLYEWNGVDAWVSKITSTEDRVLSLLEHRNELYGGTGSSGGTLVKWNGVDAWTTLAATLNGQTDIYWLAEHKNKIYGGTAATSRLFEYVPYRAITGLFDFQAATGEQFSVFATNDGKIYKNPTTTLKTDWERTNSHVSIAQFEQLAFFANGYGRPQTWNGTATTTSNITSIPADWTGVNNPAQLIKHGRGGSERMWAIGCLSTPYTVYASANGNANDFSDVNVILIYIETGDAFGIVGAVEFNDRLFCFGKKKTYIIDDESTTTSNWGYDDAPWEGGVAHWKLIVKTPNDIVAMTEQGDVYSVIATEDSHDYKASSLTQDTYMYDWIRANLDLEYIERFHAIYDPELRAIRFFVVRTGQTTCDTCLLYFIDRPPSEAWIIHDNLNYDSGFEAASSAVIKVATGEYKIHTGDYTGYLWELESSAANDQGAAIWAGFKTPPIDCGTGRLNKQFQRGWITAEPQGTETITIGVAVDGAEQTALATSITCASGIRRYPFDIRAAGQDIELELSNNTSAAEFSVSELQIDWKPKGAKAAK